MKLLLDTHIWLWSLLSPTKLDKKVIQALTDTQNELYISPITIWETIILAEKGRISIILPPAEWVKKALEQSPVEEVKLSHQIAIKSRLIKLPHNDPADRFIAATAWEYNLTLITVDKKLRESKQINIF